MLRWCAAILVALLVVATPAGALPGDAGFAPLTPADGAAVPVDPDGIPVTFTCPVYRISSAGGGFDVFGGARDYGVSFSTSARIGSDGRLDSDDVVALASGAQDGVDRCTAGFAAGGAPPRPQETPGTYYWQVWRLCTGCQGSYEAGPVRRLVLRASATAALRPPARVFAGYPFILGLSLAGVPDFTPVRIERRAGERSGRITAPAGTTACASRGTSATPRPAATSGRPRAGRGGGGRRSYSVAY